MFSFYMTFTNADANTVARLASAGNPVVQGEHCRCSFAFIISLLIPPI